MNKGSARKWCEELKTTKFKFTSSQLRFDNYCCPVGVLCNFLDPDDWVLTWDKCSYLWGGQLFTLNLEGKKRCKIKTDLVPFYNFIDKGCYSYEDAIKYIESHFEKM